VYTTNVLVKYDNLSLTSLCAKVVYNVEKS